MTEEIVQQRIEDRRTNFANWVRDVVASNVGCSSRKGQRTSKTSAGDEPLRATTSTASKAGKGSETPSPFKIFSNGELLEMYTYHRIVYDEFSYENSPVAICFQQLVSSSKWILSGTPAISNLGQLCDIGTLINTHVARAAPSMPGYFPRITVGPRMVEQTDSEEFFSYSESLSAQLAYDRHQQGRNFVKHFFRKNLTHVDHVKFDECIRLVNLSFHDTFVYNLVQRVLHDAKWDVEEIPGHLGYLIRDILNQESTGNDTSKVKASCKSPWSGAIDALLLLTSVSTSYVRSGFEAMSWVMPNEELTVAKLARGSCKTTNDYLGRCVEILTSHFDLMMYLAKGIKENNTRRSDAQQAKEDAYMGHMQNIIDIFRKKKAEAFGNRDCLAYVFSCVVYKSHLSQNPAAFQQLPSPDIWDCKTWSQSKGGPGRYNCADWWPIEPNAKFSADEVEDMSHHLIDGASLDKEDILARIRENQDNFDDGVNTFMALALGLKNDADGTGMSARLAKHFQGMLKKEDFEFGVQIPHKRPALGEKVRARGQNVDETLNCFMLVIQSIVAGIKVTADAWRRARFSMKAANMIQGYQQRSNHIAATCDYCKEIIVNKLSGYLSIACGHTACQSCYELISHQRNQLCSAKDSCFVSCEGTYIPWELFVEANRANLHDESMTKTSQKAKEIHLSIIDNVKLGEKVLIFAAYNGIKQEVWAKLKKDPFITVYMTNGTESDSDTIRDFKKDPRTAVLIQSLMSSESAGTNLTEANHIMFAGVLCTDSENYDMYMRQAKGRVIRQGQEKKVHIYHFVTLGTIEFDILNKRLKYKLRDHCDGEVFLPLPDDAPTDPIYPLTYRPYLDSAQVEKLLRSVEVEEFEQN